MQAIAAPFVPLLQQFGPRERKVLAAAVQEYAITSQVSVAVVGLGSSCHSSSAVPSCALTLSGVMPA